LNELRECDDTSGFDDELLKKTAYVDNNGNMKRLFVFKEKRNMDFQSENLKNIVH